MQLEHLKVMQASSPCRIFWELDGNSWKLHWSIGEVWQRSLESPYGDVMKVWTLNRIFLRHIQVTVRSCYCSDAWKCPSKLKWKNPDFPSLIATCWQISVEPYWGILCFGEKCDYPQGSLSPLIYFLLYILTFWTNGCGTDSIDVLRGVWPLYQARLSVSSHTLSHSFTSGSSAVQNPSVRSAFEQFEVGDLYTAGVTKQKRRRRLP